MRRSRPRLWPTRGWYVCLEHKGYVSDTFWVRTYLGARARARSLRAAEARQAGQRFSLGFPHRKVTIRRSG